MFKVTDSTLTKIYIKVQKVRKVSKGATKAMVEKKTDTNMVFIRTDYIVKLTINKRLYRKLMILQHKSRQFLAWSAVDLNC